MPSVQFSFTFQLRFLANRANRWRRALPERFHETVFSVFYSRRVASPFCWLSVTSAQRQRWKIKTYSDCPLAYRKQTHLKTAQLEQAINRLQLEGTKWANAQRRPVLLISRSICLFWDSTLPFAPQVILFEMSHLHPVTQKAPFLLIGHNSSSLQTGCFRDSFHRGQTV